MTAIDIVKSFGPTPLDELTARVSGAPSEVADEINRLTKDDLLQITDEAGRNISSITPEQAESASYVVGLSPKAIKRSLAR